MNVSTSFTYRSHPENPCTISQLPQPIIQEICAFVGIQYPYNKICRAFRQAYHHHVLVQAHSIYKLFVRWNIPSPPVTSVRAAFSILLRTRIHLINANACLINGFQLRTTEAQLATMVNTAKLNNFFRKVYDCALGQLADMRIHLFPAPFGPEPLIFYHELIDIIEPSNSDLGTISPAKEADYHDIISLLRNRLCYELVQWYTRRSPKMRESPFDPGDSFLPENLARAYTSSAIIQSIIKELGRVQVLYATSYETKIQLPETIASPFIPSIPGGPRTVFPLFFLPREISLYRELVELDLSRNHLVSIPPNIRLLKKLKILDLSFNENLEALPGEIAEMVSLRFLDLFLTSVNTIFSRNSLPELCIRLSTGAIEGPNTGEATASTSAKNLKIKSIT